MATSRKILDQLQRFQQLVNNKTRDGVIPTTESVIVEANPQRVCLHFIAASANDIWLWPFFPGVIDSYIVINPTNTIRRFTLEEDKLLATMEWRGYASAAGSRMIVIEQIYR